MLLNYCYCPYIRTILKYVHHFANIAIIYTVFGQHALAPNISIITSINETAIEWARTFNTVALIPYSDADISKTSDMVVRSINDPGMFITSVFLKRKDHTLSKAGKLFLQEIGIL